jgi:hypothetical protein
MTTRHIRSIRKKSKYEKMAERKELLEHHLKGKGLYRFRNRNRNATLELAKPGISVLTGESVTVVGPADPNVPGSGEWDGDDYFLQTVRSREAILVKTIRGPEEDEPETKEEVVEEVVEESVKEEATEMTDEKKLILDQPDQVTAEGTVEQVVPKTDDEPLNEKKLSPREQVETLLTEDPMDGLEILND